MNKDFYEETGSSTSNNHSRSQGGEADGVTRALGQIQCSGQEYGYNSIGTGGDDCDSENFVVQGRAESLGGILEQLVKQNRAILQMLEAQNELLSQITLSDNPEDPENPEN